MTKRGIKSLLDKCLSTLYDLGYKVTSSDNGDIIYEKEDSDEAHFYLDNLLRKYVQVDPDKKNIEILTHFKQLSDQTKAYDYLYKDFDYAKQFLKILLKADDILPNNDDFVYQRNYPELLTFLVLDFEEQFHYVKKNEVYQWEIDELELFEIAKENISLEEIEIKQFNFHDKYDIFALFSRDFSASYTLLTEQKLDFAIGRFGTLIALPTKGTAFLYVIETNEVLDVISTIYSAIEQFFNEDPGNITLDFYWYYEGQFQLFNKTLNEDGSISISKPKKLNDLLD